MTGVVLRGASFPDIAWHSGTTWQEMFSSEKQAANRLSREFQGFFKISSIGLWVFDDIYFAVSSSFFKMI